MARMEKWLGGHGGHGEYGRYLWVLHEAVAVGWQVKRRLIFLGLFWWWED